MLLCKCMSADCPNRHYQASCGSRTIHGEHEHVLPAIGPNSAVMASSVHFCPGFPEAEEDNDGEAMGGDRA